MGSVKTAKDFFASIAPQAVTLSELPATIVIPVTLDPAYDGGFDAAYRGSLDEAETITAVAYLGTDNPISKLEQVFAPADVNNRESQHQTRKRRLKWAWGSPDARQGESFVVIMTPDSLPMELPVLGKDGEPTGKLEGRTFRLEIVED